MIVAVTMRLAPSPSYAEERDAISHDWVRLLTGLGLIPVPLPNGLPDPGAVLARIRAGALVLSGGGDVGRAAGEPERVPAPDERDRTEAALIDAALARALPVLGVCRGFQALNMHLGGGLSRGLTGGAHVGTHHAVALSGEPLGLRWPDERPQVNSFHADGIRPSQLAPDLRPFAVTDDGLVEGAAHPRAPVLGVQWHPERPGPGVALDDALVRRWLARCA